MAGKGKSIQSLIALMRGMKKDEASEKSTSSTEKSYDSSAEKTSSEANNLQALKRGKAVASEMMRHEGSFSSDESSDEGEPKPVTP
ncbi:hypothetical protein A2U01_0008657 [Trifolium medium]|uniref:Uncharacterized protein n=1 Tax=Trifolium medium TaxID=97028 RepID=A0A392MLB9_9FABA|nr:hypothetical protein [Trifolium medium]